MSNSSAFGYLIAKGDKYERHHVVFGGEHRVEYVAIDEFPTTFRLEVAQAIIARDPGGSSLRTVALVSAEERDRLRDLLEHVQTVLASRDVAHSDHINALRDVIAIELDDARNKRW